MPKISDRLQKVLDILDIQIATQCDCTRYSRLRIEDNGSCELIVSEYSHGEDIDQYSATISANTVDDLEEREQANYTPEMERSQQDFDWGDLEDVTTLITEFKKNGATENDVRDFIKVAGLKKQELIILKVFDAPLEAFLTHTDMQVREYGLGQQKKLALSED